MDFIESLFQNFPVPLPVGVAIFAAIMLIVFSLVGRKLREAAKQIRLKKDQKTMTTISAQYGNEARRFLEDLNISFPPEYPKFELYRGGLFMGRSGKIYVVANMDNVGRKALYGLKNGKFVREKIEPESAGGMDDLIFVMDIVGRHYTGPQRCAEFNDLCRIIPEKVIGSCVLFQI